MKKGSASIFLWVIAGIIILALMLILIAGTGFITAKRGAVKSNVIFFQKPEGYIFLENNFQNFLNKQIVFNGKTMLISKFIEESYNNKGEQEFFEKEANLFFSKITPDVMWGVMVSEVKGENVFLRAGNSGCDFGDFENNIVSIYALKYRKISFCADKEYYKLAEGLKYVPQA